MALNKYFNYYSQTGDLSNEQKLYNDMLVESIQINGVDVYYISKETNNIDHLWGEDSIKRYVDAKPIEMYIESFENFEHLDTLGIMGYTVKDEINLMVAKTRFIEEFGHQPHEGDLIMVPLTNDTQKGILFEIRFVEDEQQFYPLAKLMHYKIKCSLYEHSNEEFDTDNIDIDTINLDDLGIDQTEITQNEGDNQLIESEAENIIDSSEQNPFGEY